MSEPPHRAWWSGTLASFRAQDPSHIIERLAFRLVETHRLNHAQQLRAWHQQIELLIPALADFPPHWRLLFEYPLLRLGRRLDAVLLSDHAIILIEFKTLNSSFGAEARRQALEYAYDLRDFHAASKNCVIVPIVVAATGKPLRHQWNFFWPGVSDAYECLPAGLPELLTKLFKKIIGSSVDITSWERATYKPVPTIIEAARSLYEKHGVADMRTYRTDDGSLKRTTTCLLNAISTARQNNEFQILFVTGIPGAGKTLCGLDAVFSADSDATFLTGTLPMVYVLKAALAEDAKKHRSRSRSATQHEAKSKIQSITGFLRYYIAEPRHLPEHVIVFDEAQRAWDAAYGATKFDHKDSEAGIVLDIMSRHQNYAVIIALVGNGQEINSGEAGLAEWGRALASRPHWNISGAPNVLEATDPRQRLFRERPGAMVLNPDLHLDVPIRNVRSAAAAPWVDAVLRGDAEAARSHAGPDLPFFLTRSLPDMRRALRFLARGGRRAGLVCSSGAKRLIADGIWPKFEHMDENLVANWFLKSWPDDVRASDALEIPATEFACQGLELDAVGLCWGGDLTWAGGWLIRYFSGTKWNQTRKPDAQDFQINTYRVLLTRARAETIIWVPVGDQEDKTRDPESFERTANFLLQCGARPLPNFSVQTEAEPQTVLL